MRNRVDLCANIKRRFCACLLLCLSVTSVLAQEAAASCKVANIAQWQQRNLRWEGPCRDGKADGSGVLRAYDKSGAATEIFYGRMREGELDIGVMEVPDGYKAGRFVKGQLQADGTREIVIKAFDLASASAKAYSQRLHKAGNFSSAAFYQKKAQELAQQMD